MYGDSPAKNTVCTPYIPIHVWLWPTLFMRDSLNMVITYKKEGPVCLDLEQWPSLFGVCRLKVT